MAKKIRFDRIIICGGREWDDYYAIKSVIEKLPRNTVIIHGACRGADKLAERACVKLRRRFKRYPADWIRYRRGAGPIRNTQMLVEERPVKVIAFHDDIENSTGTKDMIAQAEDAGIEVELHVE